MEQPHYYAQDLPPHHSPWMEPQHSQGYHSQHQSPINEYPGFGFANVSSSYDQTPYHAHPRPSHQQLQPLITTPWPSALASQQSSYASHPSVPPPPPLQPSPHSGGPPMTTGLPMPGSLAAAPQLSSSGTSTIAGSNPRKTLTDADRRNMCRYHEENPSKKQTEIGEIFGVERSTVSKVLRQKEKYLNLNNGAESPVKKVKKYPDIERTLAKWATNQQSKGVLVTDELLKSQAKLWWLASGNQGDIPVKVDNSAWLEKFKHKHNLHGTKQRKSSIKSVGSPTFDSPTSASPDLKLSMESPLIPETPALARQDSSTVDGLGIRNARGPFHSQSNTSLSSTFTEQAAAFSSDGGSTAVSPDGLSSVSSYFPPSGSHGSTPGSNIRPRSQTFPVTAPDDAYMSPPQSADPVSPNYSTATAVFDSQHQDMPPPSMKLYPQNSSHALRAMQHTKSMPSLKAKSLQDAEGLHNPTVADARRGLEAAMMYLNSQPSSWNAQDIATLRRVMSHLRLQESGAMPGGLHRIPEQEFGRDEDEIDLGAMPMVGVAVSPPPSATAT